MSNRLSTTRERVECVKHQTPFLPKVLAEADSNRRRELIRLAYADKIDAVSELVLNTLRGNVPRSRYTEELLKPRKKFLRKISEPGLGINTRRKAMMRQKGGGFWLELFRCHKRLELVNTSIEDSPMFLQLQDKYRQQLMEVKTLSKAAELGAKEP